MSGQKIFIFGGPDRCGKTTLAKTVAAEYNIPYYKAVNQQWIAKNDPSVFRMQTKWAEPKLLDFIKQTGQSVVFDRSFPCDYVYSKVFNRETDLDMIDALDEEYAQLGAVFVVTLRGQYHNVVDEWDKINVSTLRYLDEMYRGYAARSKMKSVILVSGEELNDFNLDSQLNEIRKAERKVSK